MTCQLNNVPTSEYDYYLHLRRAENEECVGPLISISFDARVELMIDLVFASIPAVQHYWESRKTGRDAEKNLTVQMCLRHWLELSAMLGAVATDNNSQPLKASAYKLITDCCKAVGFDYKEILPYMTSFLRMEEHGDLYKDI